MTTSLSYTYRYPFESALLEGMSEPTMRWATSLEGTSDDLFFDGKLRRPALVGQCLNVLTDIVRTRFYQQFDSRALDPVVTSGGGMLRFEGFSSCCGVYARVDLAPEAFDVELRGKGTTNVDFNNAMRSSLRMLTDRQDARLQVGGAGVTLTRDGDAVVERKVKLPSRWIKGFCEAQAYQPRLTPVFELNLTEIRDLMRSLPRGGASRQPVFLTRVGRVMRFGTRDQRGAVKIEGTDRIRVLEPLFPFTKKLTVWYDENAHTSGWDLDCETVRFFSLISPELSRGFSGEGQMLSRLATGVWQHAMPGVIDSLNWQSKIDSAQLAVSLSVSEAAIEAALAVLGARGLAGFDVTTGHYFHRVLPFELDDVEKQQPRLQAARRLVESSGVRVVVHQDDAWDVEVDGTDVEHYVRLRREGDRCTCPWFSRHQGQRGPCKHVLAARLSVEGENSATIKAISLNA